MEIGKAWTKTNDKKETYLSCVLDETFTTLIPQLKDCGLIIKHVPQDERKSEKSPHWNVRLYKMSDVKKADTKEAEADIQAEAEEDLTEQIPF